MPLDEITRFPHAVLEVKLEVQGEDATPEWVVQLINSGLLHETHKFSKFIHGCAVLLPEEVRAVPYWIDDHSLVSSIVASGAEAMLESAPGANQTYNHLLVHNKDGGIKDKPMAGVKGLRLRNKENFIASGGHDISVSGGGGILNIDDEVDEVPITTCGEYMGMNFPYFCEHAAVVESTNIVIQKVEPKLLFANERTFIKWLHMAVVLSSVAIGILAFTSSDSNAQIYALTLLPVALIFVIYAMNTFVWRVELIRTRNPCRWDDPMGPIILAGCLTIALSVQFLMQVNMVIREIQAANSGS